MTVAVVLGPSTFGDADRSPREQLERCGLRLIDNPYKRKLTRQEIRSLLTPDVIGLIAGLEPLDRDVLSGSALKVISRVGSGLSNVDLEAARDLGIAVRSTPDGPTGAVAELTLAAMLALVRGLPRLNDAVHAGGWPKTVGGQLAGKTVAVIGFGRIGRRVAALIRAFGAHPVAVDPALPASGVDGVPAMPLHDALDRADIVSVHVSGEACVLGDAELARLKPGAFVCNGARGGVVDERALLAHLESGHLAGAWLDVFEEEPYKGPLAARPDVLLTPHVGSYTRECRLQMETEAATNLIDALRAARAL
jgi:D-3-phosphoglycerate dehydrogenase